MQAINGVHTSSNNVIVHLCILNDEKISSLSESLPIGFGKIAGVFTISDVCINLDK